MRGLVEGLLVRLLVHDALRELLLLLILLSRHQPELD